MGSNPLTTASNVLRLEEALRKIEFLGMHPKIVQAQHGWWYPEKEPPEYGWREYNANLLLAHEPNDPIIGSEPWKGFLCRVYKS